MKRYRGFVLFLFLLILSCNTDRFFDPTLFHSEFKGITYTNIEYLQEHGVNDSMMIVDPDDWENDPVWPYTDIMRSSTVSLSIQTLSNYNFELSQDTIGIPVDPFWYPIYPAYPNPIGKDGTCRIRFSLPALRPVIMAIIDKDYNIVKTFVSGFMPAGDHILFWDLTNDAGEKVCSDVYRCIYYMGDFQGHGDIWVLNSE